MFGSHLTLHVRPIDARSGSFAKGAADSLLVTAVSDSDFECVCAVGVQLRFLRTVGGFLRCARQSGAAQRSDYFNEKSHHERLADTESIRESTISIKQIRTRIKTIKCCSRTVVHQVSTMLTRDRCTLFTVSIAFMHKVPRSDRASRQAKICLFTS